jgi:hypothetical protein
MQKTALNQAARSQICPGAQVEVPWFCGLRGKGVKAPEEAPRLSHRLRSMSRSQDLARHVPHQEHAGRSVFEGDHGGHRHADPAGSSHHRQLVFQASDIAVHFDHHVVGTKRGALLDGCQDYELAGINRSAFKRKPGRLKVHRAHFHPQW